MRLFREETEIGWEEGRNITRLMRERRDETRSKLETSAFLAGGERKSEREGYDAYKVAIRALLQREAGEVKEGFDEGWESGMGGEDASGFEAFLDEVTTFGEL